MKKSVFIAVIVILFLLSLIAAGVTLYKYEAGVAHPSSPPKTNQTSKVSLPYINSQGLTVAKVGVNYQAQVYATLLNSNGDLYVNVVGLPKGLSLGKCIQEYDVSLSPAPNTRSRCPIQGVPAISGRYWVKISASNADGYTENTVEQMVSLVVSSK